jgi:hypothetical protein
MFQAHSFLWHYLWVAPNLLFGALAIILWKRSLHKELRGLFFYAWFQAIQCAVLFPLDHVDGISGWTYWRVYLASELLEAVVVFVLISDLFADVFGSYAALARMGKLLIRRAGGSLVIVAAVVTAFAPIDRRVWLYGAVNIVQEAMYIIVTGLMLLLFASAAYFGLAWRRRTFGIALGLGITGCVHLATWGLGANGFFRRGTFLEMLYMATTHVVVLMWFYYLLVPARVAARTEGAPPDNNLALWNRELERLLQQ